MTKDGKWELEPPKITATYNELDLPPAWLINSLQRDKYDGALIRWVPAYLEQRTNQAVQDFLTPERKRELLAKGFDRLWFRGDEFYINSGERVQPKPAPQTPEKPTIPTFEASQGIAMLNQELEKLPLTNGCSFSISESSTNSHVNSYTEETSIALDIKFVIPGIEAFSILSLAATSIGFDFYGDKKLAKYQFNAQEVAQQVKQIIREKFPNYLVNF